jgi:hypothetical protein
MNLALLPLLLAASLVAPSPAWVDKKPPPQKPALDIQLEQQGPGGGSEPVAVDHVFAVGDVVRFRLTSEFDGFLYVMDQGTSGHFASVFPSAEAGADNRVHRGESFLVPATNDGWFQITGPAGFDVLYFLLSPAPIAAPSAASFVAPGPVSSLKPRCNDAIFKARGDCTDLSAGPAPLPAAAPLPAPLQGIAGAASRDIVVTRKSDGVVVTSHEAKSAPVIYTFRLAHQ